MKLRISVLFCLSVFLPIAIGQSQKPASTGAAASGAGNMSGPLVARVGDTGFVQIRAESFDALTPQQKTLAYWLTQASIAIDPIIYDQLSQFGLRQKRLLEEIVARSAVVVPPRIGCTRGVVRRRV